MLCFVGGLGGAPDGDEDEDEDEDEEFWRAKVRDEVLFRRARATLVVILDISDKTTSYDPDRSSDCPR